VEVDVTATLGAIEFAPTNTVTEILQNVRTILGTPKYSVPLDRDFGINATMLDEPLPVAQARLTAEIIAAVERWEPRAQVVRVSYADMTTGDANDGVLRPKVRVRIIE
jgi:hypothetical protein